MTDSEMGRLYEAVFGEPPPAVAQEDAFADAEQRGHGACRRTCARGPEMCDCEACCPKRGEK